MMDMEKINEAFDEAKEHVWRDDDEYTIGYNNGLEAGKSIALALINEQEAVEPIEVFRKDTNCHEYHCKRCGNKVGTILGGKHPILPGVKLSIEHFCDVCGKAVKWDV